MDQVPKHILRGVRAIEVALWIGDLILHKKVHIDDVVIAGNHLPLVVHNLVALGGAAICAVAKLDLLIDIDRPLLGLLDAKGKLKVDASAGDLCDLAKGGHHRLMFVVYGVPAGAGRHKNQHQNHCGSQNSADLLATGSFGPGGLFVPAIGRPVIGSVFHMHISFFV